MTFTGTHERLINRKPELFQRDSSISALESGGFVSSWTTYGNASYWDSRGIYQRSFDEEGQPTTGDHVVHDIVGRPRYSDVAGLAGGGWVTAYQANEPGGPSRDSVSFSLFGADGEQIGHDKRVRMLAGYTSNQPKVAGLEDGGFVVSWWAIKNTDSNPAYDVFQVRYDQHGSLVGTVHQINETTKGAQAEQAIAATSDGGWVSIWSDIQFDKNEAISSAEIYLNRYDKKGNTVVDQLVVSQGDGHFAYIPDVTELSGGATVVTWESYLSDGSKMGVKEQIVSADGELVGDAIDVNTTTAGQQRMPVVTGLHDGGWVVAWESEAGGDTDIYMQRFSSDGEKVGQETIVNQVTDGKQLGTAIATLSDGSFVVTWTSSKRDDNGTGIAERRFSPDFFGKDGADHAIGTDIGDKMFGRDGDDVLNGKGGNDILVGGTGTDRFVFTDGFGADVIRDFGDHKTTSELIDFHWMKDAPTYNDIVEHAKQTGNDTVLHLGDGNTVKIVDFSVDDLSKDMFVV
jgi:Ca2+-binding RTX toxin-like protein